MNISYTVYAPRYHRQLIIITIILLPPYTLYTQLVKQSNFTQQFFTVSSPHSNRWLYWMDVSHQTLEKASVFGNTSTTLVDELRCTWPLTMDYTTHTLYWPVWCENAFWSLTLAGDRKFQSYPYDVVVPYLYSLAIIRNNVYWVFMDGVYTIQLSGEGHERVTSYSGGSFPLHLQVVHPSQQPAGT